ncbi:hypothetical protein HDU85_001469 [Gaertneriomyces sp. JEL0708]|nr:hypothetical protein HDU85_001469 [Gaertneriomyces sp. JEL0708]
MQDIAEDKDAQVNRLKAELKHQADTNLQLEKERQSLEHELKKSNNLLAKSKDAKALAVASDEIQKLKLELEFLSDQKLQNTMLKENIHQLVARGDQQKRDLESKIASLTNELNVARDSNTKTADIPVDIKVPPPPYSADRPDITIAALLEISRAETKALEVTVKDLRQNMEFLQALLEESRREVTRLKSDLDRKAPLESVSGTAGASSRSWWGRGTQATTTQPAAKTETTSSDSVDTVENRNEPKRDNSPPGSQPTKTWWNRAANNATNTEGNKELESLRKEYVTLQDKLKDMSAQLDQARAEHQAAMAKLAELESQRGALPNAVLDDYDAASNTTNVTSSGNVLAAEENVTSLKEQLEYSMKQLRDQQAEINSVEGRQTEYALLQEHNRALQERVDVLSKVAAEETQHNLVVEQLRQELRELHHKYDDSLNQLSNMRELNDKLQADIEAARVTEQNVFRRMGDDEASVAEIVHKVSESGDNQEDDSLESLRCKPTVSTDAIELHDAPVDQGPSEVGLDVQSRERADVNAQMGPEVVQLRADLERLQSSCTAERLQRQQAEETWKITEENLEAQLAEARTVSHAMEAELVQLRGNVEKVSDDVASAQQQQQQAEETSRSVKASMEEKIRELRTALEQAHRGFEVEQQRRQQAEDTLTVTQKGWETQIADVRAALEKADSDQERYRQEVHNQRSLIEQHQTNLANNSLALNAAQAELEAERRQLIIVTSAQELAVNQVQLELDSTKTALTVERERLTAMTKAHEVAISDLQLELDTFRSQADQHAAAAGDRTSKFEEALERMRLELVSQHHVDRASIENEHRQKMEELQLKHAGELRAARGEMDEIRARLGTKEQELDALNSSMEKELGARDISDKKITSLVDEASHLQTELQESQKHQMSLNARVIALESELSKRSQELAEQTAAVRKLQEEKKTVCGELAEARRLMDETMKSEKTALEERVRKERVDMEEKARRERMDLDDKLKGERKERQKVQSDFEKLKKDSSDLQRRLEREIIMKGEELGASLRKLKGYEQEANDMKAERVKIEELQKELESRRKIDTDRLNEISQLRDQIRAQQSTHDITVGELEVVRASLDRSNKNIAEKDESIRKLRARIDELHAAETQYRRTVAKLEKERNDTGASLVGVEQKLAAVVKELAHRDEEIHSLSSETEGRARTAEEERKKAVAEVQDLTLKIRELEGERRIIDKKNAQMIRDLQKQLSKEKRQRELQQDAQEASGETSPNVMDSNSDLAKKSKLMSMSTVGGSQTMGASKVERLTDDLLHLAQENEALNKRARHAEEEFKIQSERVHRLTEELEKKSAVVRQYILREHSKQLEPEEKPRTFNWNILSNTTAMQRVDPAVLAQINTKLQKLLEDMTTKVMALEGKLQV